MANKGILVDGDVFVLSCIQQLPAPCKQLIDRIKQNYKYNVQENDWTTDNLTNNKRLFNCDKRLIEMHQ